MITRMTVRGPATKGPLLYRLFNAEGELLYVGQTGDMSTRLRAHKSDKPWWPEAVELTTTPMASKEAAVEAERLAIRTERPRYNIQLAVGLRMVPLSFRATQDAKDQGYAKAARLGLNPTEVMRDLWTEWAESDEDQV